MKHRITFTSHGQEYELVVDDAKLDGFAYRAARARTRKATAGAGAFTVRPGSGTLASLDALSRKAAAALELVRRRVPESAEAKVLVSGFGLRFVASYTWGEHNARAVTSRDLDASGTAEDIAEECGRIWAEYAARRTDTSSESEVAL